MEAAHILEGSINSGTFLKGIRASAIWW